MLLLGVSPYRPMLKACSLTKRLIRYNPYINLSTIPHLAIVVEYDDWSWFHAMERTCGHPGYHVIVECGTQICRSKTSSENLDKIYWNEKFVFQYPTSELDTLNHLKLRIVNEEYLGDGECVGETLIFIKGIIAEGNRSGLIQLNPALFNVVLEDDTYKGQITIGLKFVPNAVLHAKRKESEPEGNDLGKSVCTMLTSLWKMRWLKFFSNLKNRKFVNTHKEN
ncbi:calcium-dependent lipid-binding family protein [Striga asiatica]|uniref:Calcium-dependent lipid-binding family protein n=1 Tax=Striga asiatica TaxID=4170 RepID=A0A5A7QLA9_STRAF|nr:calcium-dependent lipid-binding family protein [Striga asiatica]